MRNKVKLLSTGLTLILLSLISYACDAHNADEATSYISFYTGAPELDSLFPDNVTLRSANDKDSVIILNSGNISSASGESGWYSTTMFYASSLPFDGEGFIVFTIDSLVFEIPTQFNFGFCRNAIIKIGGDNRLSTLAQGKSLPLPVGIQGTDSLYYWLSEQ